MNSSHHERLLDIMRDFAQRRVVIVGDMLADQFLYGEISRVSREAPVLILRHERTETVPGGAANCALNLAALGAQARMIGVVGTDEPGAALIEKLTAADVDCSGVIKDESRPTTTKVRVLAGGAHSLRQQVIRVDYEPSGALAGAIHDALRRKLEEALTDADAAVISDYNYGVADEHIAATLRQIRQKRDVHVLVDSRFRLADFAGFTGATPNEDEVEILCGRRFTDADELEAAGRDLRARLDLQTLLITRGKHGMMLFESNRDALHIPAVGSLDAVDVTGAGDTVIAAYALALACGATSHDAAQLANHAGGLVVMKRGTATVTPDELRASILNR